MARKGNRPPDAVKIVQKRGSVSLEDRDIKKMLKEFASSPAVKYVAAGITTALLTRFANRINHRYPEISTFIRENMHTLEGKIEEFRNSMQSGYSQRH
jgi:hypothetical protein